jgi:hypothetical protein
LTTYVVDPTRAAQPALSSACGSGYTVRCRTVLRGDRRGGRLFSRPEGGYVPDFVAIVRQYNISGDPFRIEGICKSACTLFLGIRNVCVERSASLMFHGGDDIAENVTGPDTRASRAALYRYNGVLRRYLLDGHFLDTDSFHPLPGSAIIDRFGYRECEQKK